jgi:hypothetical protein
VSEMGFGGDPPGARKAAPKADFSAAGGRAEKSVPSRRAPRAEPKSRGGLPAERLACRHRDKRRGA